MNEWVNAPDFPQTSSFQPPPAPSSCMVIEKAAEKQSALIREYARKQSEFMTGFIPPLCLDDCETQLMHSVLESDSR